MGAKGATYGSDKIRAGKLNDDLKAYPIRVDFFVNRRDLVAAICEQWCYYDNDQFAKTRHDVFELARKMLFERGRDGGTQILAMCEVDKAHMIRAGKIVDALFPEMEF